MRRSLLSLAIASMFLAGAGLASAQTTTTTTTTTWTTDQGSEITAYSSTKKYTSFIDPTLKPVVGMVLPDTVALYPLPETMKIEDPDRYSYGIVNQHPVLVERATRTVVHTWE